MITANEARNKLCHRIEQDSIKELQKIEEAIEVAIQSRRNFAEVDFTINPITSQSLSKAGYHVEDGKAEGSTKIIF